MPHPSPLLFCGEGGLQLLCGDLLQHLKDDAKATPFRFAEQHVNVFGHDHIALDIDPVPAAHILKSLFEDAVRGGSGEKRLALVATAGDEVEIVCILVTLQTPWHTTSLENRGEAAR